MSDPLDEESRSILEYTPEIGYVEPRVISEAPEQIHSELESPNVGLGVAKATHILAKNVQKIAEIVQDEADKLAEGFCVELDSKVDYAAVAAMRRHYPEASSTKICYEQYKKCKEEMRVLANGVSGKVLSTMSEENVKKEIAAVDKALGPDADMSSLLEAVGPNKSNRPEDDKSFQIIEPMDITEFQDNMARYLVNLLWKKFIKPVIPLPPGVNFLPDEIAPLPEGAPTPQQMMGEE
jgi:hypothetical protein